MSVTDVVFVPNTVILSCRNPDNCGCSYIDVYVIVTADIPGSGGGVSSVV